MNDDKFFSKIDHYSKKPCWIWTGHMMKHGYGKIQRDNKEHTVHRYSWIVHCGDIPAGMSVLHKCDVRNCVNPEHLFLGTQQDNITDMIRKGRKNARKGSKVPGSVLKESDIHIIRKEISDGKRMVEIAEKFDVDVSNIYRIKNNRIWRHV